MPNKNITKKNLRPNKSSRRGLVVFVSVLLLCLVLLVIILIKVPPSMDEFLPYHQIACSFYPNGSENIFRESCGTYDLNVFGHSLPLRAYSYTGFTPSLIYFPFFLLWKSYFSARILKLFVLLLLAFCVKKIAKLSGWMVSLLVLMCLPLALQFVIDLGPFAFQGLIALAAAYLIARSRSYVGGAIAGLIIFIGFDQKPIFSVLIIPIIVLTIALIIEKRKDFIKERGKRLGIIILAVISALVPLSVLLLSKNNSGISYLKELTMHPAIGIFDFSRQYQQFQTISPYLGSFEKFGHLMYDTHNASSFPTVIIWVMYGLLIIFALYKKLTDKDEDIQNSFWPFLASIFGFIFSIWGVSRMSESGNAHHPIIAFPFLILAIAFAIKSLQKNSCKIAVIVVVVIASLNVYMGYNLLTSPILSQHDWSRLNIINEFNNTESSRKYLYVCADWGMYYLMSLYGPKEQTVLFIDPINSKNQIDSIDKVAKRKNLTPVYIAREAYRGNVDFVKKYHLLQKMNYKGGNSSSVWQIYVTVK